MSSEDARKARLAQALRDNLRRRKAQARAYDGPATRPVEKKGQVPGDGTPP